VKAAAAMAILWMSYSLGFYGYVLLSHRNVSVKQAFVPGTSTASPWAQAGTAPPTSVFPPGLSSIATSPNESPSTVSRAGLAGP
jgi:hypothetical protein